MLSLIQMSADRAPFIDHSQSLNLPVRKNTTTNQICLAQYTAWKLGLKAVAIYRDGSKRVQPLSTGKARAVEMEAAVAAAEKILARAATGKVADHLLAQGIKEIKTKLN